MLAEVRLRLEQEAEQQALRDQEFSLNLELESAKAELQSERESHTLDLARMSEKVDKSFGFIGVLLENVSILRKNILINSVGVEKLENRANAIEGLLNEVVNKIEKNQYIEDEVNNFINNIYTVIYDLAKQLAEINNEEFDEDKFRSIFEGKNTETEYQLILPSQIVFKTGLPFAYREAVQYLLWEFKTMQGYVEQSNGNNELSESLTLKVENFKNKFFSKISYEDFEAFLLSSDNEDIILTEKNIISCHRKGVLYGVLTSALECFLEKQEQNNSNELAQKNF